MKSVVKILFICHGNICRSPMAEFIMKDLVEQAGMAGRFEIASAATSAEELGNPVYPPAGKLLNSKGIDCSGKRARQITKKDYDNFDLLIGMDEMNIVNMRRVFGDDQEGKIHMLMDFTGRPGDVADPWYTGNFEATWTDVLEGCENLLKQL